MSGGKVVAWRVANCPEGPFDFRKTEPRGWASIEPLVLQSDLAAAIARAEAAEARLVEAFDAGFNTSGEGWNGEYGESGESRYYVEKRAEALAAIAAQQAEGGKDG